MSNNFLISPLDQMIDGMYSLGAVVQRSATGAIYETGFGADARPAVIKVRYVGNPGVERLVEQWRNAVELSHPNLLRVYAAGFSKLDDAPIVYVVMERADASLAGVVAERALSETEVRELLAPALSALSYLHQNGYAHSGVKPSNILAVGDLVKLSGENAQLVEDGGDPAEDMRALGTVMVQALTTEGHSGVRTIPDVSEPVKEIVRHCLEPDPKKRWTADQVEAKLQGRTVAAAAAAPVVVPASVQEIRPLPVAEERREEREEASPSRRGIPAWILAALAALVLSVVVARYWRATNPVPAAVAPVPAADRATPAASWPEPVLKEPEARPKPSPTGRPAPAISGSRGRRAEGWSVVVAAYGNREAAEKRQKELARKWPKFNFSVFPQTTERAQFSIVIGKNISEDEADALRKRAVASGIPADTYIKKFQ